MNMDKYNLTQLRKHGEDVWVRAQVSIRRPQLVTLGSHVAIDEFFVATTALDIGNHVHISTHVSVIGGAKGLLKMGNFTNIATKGTVICISDEFKGHGFIAAPGIPEEYLDRSIVGSVTFEDFANLGANVTILPGVTLPQGTVIGACSLVRKSDALEPWTIYAGNPLRKISKRPRENILAYAKKLGYA